MLSRPDGGLTFQLGADTRVFAQNRTPQLMPDVEEPLVLDIPTSDSRLYCVCIQLLSAIIYVSMSLFDAYRN